MSVVSQVSEEVPFGPIEFGSTEAQRSVLEPMAPPEAILSQGDSEGSM